MTQEEKDLLLQDLSARLPYGVKFAITNEKTETLKSIGIDKFDLIPINLFYKKPLFYLINEFGNIEYKPYLRPMSSMTEEEFKEYRMFIDYSYNDFTSESTPCVYTNKVNDYIDWLNAHYFDYRGLIEKGLALEAPKNMYSYG